MMNFAGTSKLLAAAAAVLALQACATTYPTNVDAWLSTSPRLDARFGDAVNVGKAQQTLNPDASKNRNIVAGIDGKAAQETMVRYRESFKSPPPPANVFNIGIGSGSSQ